MSDSLAGKHILVTSGPTRADIDAVRYVSNRSSGRLGCRIAIEALRRGARVALVAGPQSATPDADGLSAEERARLRVLPVETVEDLIQALRAELTGPEPLQAVVHAMAVLDYVPERKIEEKTPSGRDAWDVRLVKTPKVIRRIKDWAPGAVLVEFKLEVGSTEEELRRVALESLRANRADLVVANDLTQIRDEVHPALILAPDGQVLARPATKGEIARALCDVLADTLSAEA
jgi:phosphopantothenoylcysteine synthetase/decarboxylase